MKYIKTYEDINKPKIGDWVILNLAVSRTTKKHSQFINTHVGQIVSKASNDIYEIDYYEIIPEMTEGQTKWWSTIDNIKIFSPDKEKLEAYINAKKYNL